MQYKLWLAAVSCHFLYTTRSNSISAIEETVHTPVYFDDLLHQLLLPSKLAVLPDLPVWAILPRGPSDNYCLLMLRDYSGNTSLPNICRLMPPHVMLCLVVRPNINIAHLICIYILLCVHIVHLFRLYCLLKNLTIFRGFLRKTVPLGGVQRSHRFVALHAIHLWCYWVIPKNVRDAESFSRTKNMSRCRRRQCSSRAWRHCHFPMSSARSTEGAPYWPHYVGWHGISL